METFKKEVSKVFKKPTPGGKISIVELIEKVKREEELSKFRKMEKVINITFERIFNVRKNEWEKKEKLINKWEKTKGKY